MILKMLITKCTSINNWVTILFVYEKKYHRKLELLLIKKCTWIQELME